MKILLLVKTIVRNFFFFVSSKILIKAFTEAHRKTIFVSNVSRNFKKKVASVTFKVYRGIFSWNSSAVTEFCIANFHIGSCAFIAQNEFN